jgi:hypothetical protein
MDSQKSVEAFGTGGHKAVFDISLSFRTELAADDKSARELIEALTEFIRAKLPGSDDPSISINRK